MIVPGSANALLLANGGDPLDEYGKIDRSVRFRASAGAVLSRLLSTTGDRLKWKMVFWCKGSGLGTSYCLFDAYSDTQNFTRCYLMADGKIQFDHSIGNTIVGQAITAGQRRDPSAHFEVAVTFDSANSVPADRMIIEIDGVRQALSTYLAPPQNSNSYMNTAGVTLFIGRTGSTALFFDGYVSFVRLFDGSIPSAGTYGVVHPRTGQWRPKSKAAIRAAVKAAGGAVRNGWGANGFFLPFDDTSSVAALGYDRSQGDDDTTGNNWTPSNISLTAGSTYDSMLDTATNNFPVYALGFGTGQLSIRNGGLTTSSDNGPPAAWRVAKGTQALLHASYWEVRIDSVAGQSPSVSYLCAGVTGDAHATVAAAVGSGADGYGYQPSGNKLSNGVQTPYGVSAAVGDVLMFAFDGEAGKLWVGKNGAWMAGGDPASGTNPTFSGIPAGRYYASISHYWDGVDAYTTATSNFGQQPFAYQAPSGFKAVCTKNLPIIPKSGVIKPSSAFVARTGSGASIVAALSAASPWEKWIRIYKRRDQAEGWRWQFHDDVANCLDSSGTTAKFALPAFAGTSYIGYALRVAAANGVATGRLVHTNGAVDIVNDGLVASRKFVILVNEAGSAWYAYHPDMTAGKLCYLNSNGVEATDATISGVAASSFTVAAALPTGVYRWIAIAEVDGLIRLGKHASNANVDGPLDQLGHRSALLLTKALTQTTADWTLLDATRDPGNPVRSRLDLNSSNAEGTSEYVDLLSGAAKVRTTHPNFNYAGQYVFLSIAAFPFRYANAR